MILIIAEKAIAGRRIAAILAGSPVAEQRTASAIHFDFKKEGEQHRVVPLRGHVVDVDFPKQYSHWLGTDLQKLTDSGIEYKETEEIITGFLKKIAPQVQTIIIATDADREGEAIGLEALDLVREKNPKVKVRRATFSAITDKDINDAFSALSEMDFELAESANTRREIDLIWGAVLTRFLSLISGRLGREFLSMGRVQGPSLALIVDREKERLAFKVRKYWLLQAQFEKDSKQFIALHKEGKFWDKGKAESALQCKEPPIGKVEEVKKTKKTLRKPVPFNTTLFLRAATAIGLTAGRAMQIAERLYQSGYLSYPRTDNSVYPASLDLKKTLNMLLVIPSFQPLVEKLLKEKQLSPSRGKFARDHPPIHPVAPVSQSKLDAQSWKVYELVCRRFMASLAPDALTESLSVRIDLNNEIFIATGQRYLEKGWKLFYPYSKATEVILPHLEKGDEAKLLKLDMLEKETQPPARYSQGALIKAMSDLNLGTKCLTANMQIKVFNTPYCLNKDMQGLFSESAGLLGSRGVELRENNKFECLSLDSKNKIQRHRFLGISKRKLNSHESVVEIAFGDGSRLQATSKHPVYCFCNGKFGYEQLRNLGEGDTVVALHINSTQGVFGRITKRELLDKCCKDTNLFLHGIAKYLKWTRKKMGVTQQQFAKELSCEQGNYANYELGKRPPPLWVAKALPADDLPLTSISSQNKKIKLSNVFPLKWTAPMARILGCLIGDGSLDRIKLGRENSVDFRYTNTNPQLIKSFTDDIECIFGVRCRTLKSHHQFKKTCYQVKVPAVIGRIIATLFPETIEKNVCNRIPKELWSDFIGAVFDDEGHVYKSETKLFISNTNHKMLKRIGLMLMESGIDSRLDLRQHKLLVSNMHSLLLFLEKIPIQSFKKKQRLIEMLSNKYRYSLSKFPLLVLYKKIFALLQEKPLQTMEIVKRLGLSKSVVVKSIHVLKKWGLVKKIVIGNNKDFKRTVKYQPTKPLTGTAFELLGEKLLKQNLITKTVVAKKKIPYSDFVYDITNSSALPNFVLANNVFVHNSTRAEIIQKLYSRKYISGQKAIEPTKVAFAVINSLERHEGIVVKPEMTANLEKEMDTVAEGKKDKESVVSESRRVLSKALEQLLKNKNEIGSAIRSAVRDDAVIGPCVREGCGGQLLVRKGRTGKRFVGCSSYPKCTQSYPLPQRGALTVLEKRCPECGNYMVKVRGKRYRFEMCIDHNCKSKETWKKKEKKKK